MRLKDCPGIPQIDPTELDRLEPYILAALTGAGNMLDLRDPVYVGRAAVAAGIQAYIAVRQAAGISAIAKPGNPEWKQDQRAVRAVTYLLSIGFNYEDFLLAQIGKSNDGR